MSSGKRVIPRQFCSLCGRAIVERKGTLEHYRKYHREYVKKARKLGRELSKEGYGKGSRRRHIRERLGLR